MPTTIVDCGSRSTGVVESLIYFRSTGSEVAKPRVFRFGGQSRDERQRRPGDKGAKYWGASAVVLVSRSRKWPGGGGRQESGGAGAINNAKEIGEEDGLSS